jgi:ABC-type antimicrobial peptide transport system permease subunit
LSRESFRFGGGRLGLLAAFAANPVGGGLAAEQWFGLSVAYSLWPVLLIRAVSGGIGLTSGIYPAYKAAKLQPIEALRIVGA